LIISAILYLFLFLFFFFSESVPKWNTVFQASGLSGPESERAKQQLLCPHSGEPATWKPKEACLRMMSISLTSPYFQVSHLTFFSDLQPFPLRSRTFSRSSLLSFYVPRFLLCEKRFRIKLLLASHASSLFVGYDEQHTLKICLLVEDFAGVLLLRRKVISKDFEDCAKKLTYLDLQEFEGIAAAGISETAAAALRRWL
jgi:hypothetical protein